MAHDRKSFITHFINGFGYLVFFFWLVYSLSTYTNPAYPSLQEQFNLHPWVWYLIVSVTFIMAERFLQRMIAIKRVYGWIPALLSVPRTFYGNILNLHAVIRAYHIYYSTPKSQASSKQPAWDKTDHHFPGSHILSPYRKKLGDILLENNKISREDLSKAILEQQKTGLRLGEVLCRMQLISKAELQKILSHQYHLKRVALSTLNAQEPKDIAISKGLQHWLIGHQAQPIAFAADTGHLTIGIDDPTNELLIEKIINHVRPYKARFVLVDPTS